MVEEMVVVKKEQIQDIFSFYSVGVGSIFCVGVARSTTAVWHSRSQA